MKKRPPKPITPEQLAEFAKLRERIMRMFDESIPENHARMEKGRRAAQLELERKESYERGVKDADRKARAVMKEWRKTHPIKGVWDDWD